MHYTITYQDVLPPYTYHYQDLKADSIEEAKKIFYKSHPYPHYAHHYIVRIDLKVK